MGIYYHLTPIKNLKGILRHGLGSKRGGSTKGLTGLARRVLREMGEEEVGDLIEPGKGLYASGTYLADSLESLGNIIRDTSYVLNRPKRFAILEVSVPDEEVFGDEDIFGRGRAAVGDYLVTKSRIPPSRVKLSGYVTIYPKKTPVYELFTPKLGNQIEGGRLEALLLEGIPGNGFLFPEDVTASVKIWKALPKTSKLKKKYELVTDPEYIREIADDYSWPEEEGDLPKEVLERSDE